jgi:hypothetical protein
MEKESEYCQYYYGNLVVDTSPDRRLAIPLRRYWWTLKKYVWFISILGLRGSLSKISPLSRFERRVRRYGKKTGTYEARESLNLKIGDHVKVRSAKEILATLDSKGKLRGLTFTPEMVKFCGREFKVYKKLNRIILEATGELRQIKSPTVLLESVFCDGKAHGECDRSCFCFWREEWLTRSQ